MSKSIEDILALAKRPEDTVALCLAGDLVAEYRDLERQLADAPTKVSNLGDGGDRRAIAEQMETLRGQMAEAEVPFRLRAIHPRKWTAFYEGRPVKAEGEPDEKFQDRWYTWVLQLVARTCVDPVMSSEQVDELVDGLSNGQWLELVNAAFVLNTGKVSVPLSVAAYVPTRNSGPTSGRPGQPESPSADGSAPSPEPSPPTSTTETD
jgi:hypothetical protein